MKLVNNYDIELAPTLSGHWYKVKKVRSNGRKRSLGVFPSSTTILNAYPQSAQLTEWIASKGWHESQRLKSAAGERGTRVHQAIEDLINGLQLSDQNYSLEEWFAINTFILWYKEYQPKIIFTEKKVFSKKLGVAGTLDLLVKIGDEYGVVDLKTSSNIYKQFPLQFASYADGLEHMYDVEVGFTAALLLGYTRNKVGFRYTLYPEWRDHIEIFSSVSRTWRYDYGEDRAREPKILDDLPKELKLWK